MARFLFFARIRETVGMGMMDIPLPREVTTVEAMLTFLRSRGEPLAGALSGSALRVAVNQVYARPGDRVTDQDEIAFFPPVSGG